MPEQGIQIKPSVFELSLAYNPANDKDFFMTKEYEMDEMLEILTGTDPLVKEVEIDAILAKQSVSAEATKALKGALKLLSKHQTALPKNIINTLVSAIPEYGYLATEVAKQVAPCAGGSATETPDEKKKREALVAAEAEKKAAEAKKDEGVGMYKETIETMKKELAEAKTAIAEAKKEAFTEKTARRTMELKKELTDMKLPGDRDKMAKNIFDLEQVNKDLAAETMAVFKVTAEAFKAAKAFDELGSVTEGTLDATKAVDKAVKDLMLKDNTLTYDKALKAVHRTNPDLVKECLVIK